MAVECMLTGISGNSSSHDESMCLQTILSIEKEGAVQLGHTGDAPTEVTCELSCS